MNEYPRHGLYRTRTTGLELRQDEQGRPVVSGYAIVWDATAEIRNWEGDFIETFRRGAATKTLAERADKIKIKWNHGFDPSVGQKPLGKPNRMEEDATGVFVEVPLSDTSYNSDLAELIRDGALDGWSFAFSSIEERWSNLDGEDGLPFREVLEARIDEFSIVTEPAYEATTLGIRSAEAFCQWATMRTAAVEDTAAPRPPQAPTWEKRKRRLYVARLRQRLEASDEDQRNESAAL
ncbi:MAG: HK97 family phage prohead protease [Phycisphaerae bacterium]